MERVEEIGTIIVLIGYDENVTIHNVKKQEEEEENVDEENQIMRENPK